MESNETKILCGDCLCRDRGGFCWLKGEKVEKEGTCEKAIEFVDSRKKEGGLC